MLNTSINYESIFLYLYNFILNMYDIANELLNLRNLHTKFYNHFERIYFSFITKN